MRKFKVGDLVDIIISSTVEKKDGYICKDSSMAPKIKRNKIKYIKNSVYLNGEYCTGCYLEDGNWWNISALKLSSPITYEKEKNL